MANSKHLTILREFRTLKKNKHIIGNSQYEKELKRLLLEIKADMLAPNLSPLQQKKLNQLLTDKDAT